MTTTTLASVKATGYTENSTSPIGSPRVIEPLWTFSTDFVQGQPVRIYKIPQVINLTYLASSYQGGRIMLNNYPVNRTDFRLIRGVNNAVLFFVRDIDRKPVPLGATDTLLITIVDKVSDTLLMQRELTSVDPAKGLYNFSTRPAEMDRWPTGPVQWSITLDHNNEGPVPLWTDQSYSPFSILYVTGDPVPGPSFTTTLTWSDFNLLSGTYYSPSLLAAAQNGYSNGMQTYVASLLNFSGSIDIQAAMVANPTDSDWFQVSDAGGHFSYVDFNGLNVLNVQGNYIWTRIAVLSVSGSIDKIQYKA